MQDEQIVQLLREIRAGQVEQLQACRETGRRLLEQAVQAREMQEKAIRTQADAFALQRRTALIYRVVVLATAAFAGFFLWKLNQF